MGEPGPGQAVVDVAAKTNGVRLGDELHLTPVDQEIEVVGFTRGRRYVMAPVIDVDMETWESIYIDSALGRMTSGDAGIGESIGERIGESMSGGASVAAVRLEPGVTAEEFSDALGGGFDVVTPEEAALAGNGMAVMVLAVDGIQWVSLVIGALVVGVFFYITTLQKTGQIAAVKALGASDAYMGRQLLAQVTILLSIAAVIGTLLALGTAAGMPPDMAIEPEAGAWALTLVSVYVAAYVGSLFSLVAILRIDPASAMNSRSDA
jgi:putative ABC transport system permease protein